MRGKSAAIEVDDETDHIRWITYFSGVTLALLAGVSIQHLSLIVILAFAIVTIRTLQELVSIMKDVAKGVVYLICLAMKDGKTCGSTAFRVRKDEKGLVVECVDCKTEHEVKG